MKKTIIILSIFAFFVSGGMQTTNAQNADSSQIDKLTDALNKSGKSFTLADGTIIIDFPKINPAMPTHNFYNNAPPATKQYGRKAPIYIIVIALIVLIYVPLQLYYTVRLKKIRKKDFKELQIFKQQALKIPVDLNDCKIKQHIYRETAETEATDRYEALDYIFLNKQPKRNTIEQRCCEVTFKATINGNAEIFCVDIPKDEFPLRILFQQQKTTYLYVDEQDTENFYFDLEFLKFEE
ncbi:MAG: hypothetical protein FWC39_02185 [Bacteroidetes bacterium]|nr:hypothetical protein [Bacteroidota bacterium]